MILLFFGIIFIIIVFGVLLNRSFWQGYRNSKFIDEVNNEQGIFTKDDSGEDQGPGNTIQRIL